MKNKEERTEGQLLSLDEYRQQLTANQLLSHMRNIREAVPVNDRLQVELREKLLLGVPNSSANIESEKNGGQKPLLLYILTAIGVSILLLLALLVWKNTTTQHLHPLGTPYEVTRYWSTDNNSSFTISPNGDMLIARDGQLLLANPTNGQYRILELPTGWIYSWPTFSTDGSNVTLVRQRPDGQPQIINVNTQELLANKMSPQQNEALVQVDGARHFTNLFWSPVGNKLTFVTSDEHNLTQVWVFDANKKQTQMITDGCYATWSPDGTKLVVQRDDGAGHNVLVLVDVESGTEYLLGEGEQPVWSARGHLLFTSLREHERVLTYLSDGSPQFTVRQLVGELRYVDAGKNGKKLLQSLQQQNNWLALSALLMSPNPTDSSKAMEWLRQVEQQGVQQPRVLLINEVERFANTVLDAKGKKLFYARPQEDVTTVMSVSLEEGASN